MELILNGRSLGTNAVTDYKAEFHTTYEAGELIAVS